MFNRRTLATITAVAALAGGAAGGVTSTVTTPESAGANHIPVSPTNPKQLRGSDPVKAALYSLRQDVDRIDARTATMDARLARIDARTAETKEAIESLSGFTARGANGRSLVNLVEDIQHKARLICAETVPVEVLGISGRDPACD